MNTPLEEENGEGTPFWEPWFGKTTMSVEDQIEIFGRACTPDQDEGPEGWGL